MDITIFVAVTAAAVLLQTCILFGMFLAVRKSSARMAALTEDFRTRILPTAEIVQSMLLELRPKIETAVSNVSESTTLVRAQIERLDATVSDVIDRSRLQIIRADDLVTRTMDRVEETTDIVHKSVVSPVRRVAGLIQGLTTGLEYLAGNRRRPRDRAAVPQDEMFI